MSVQYRMTWTLFSSLLDLQKSRMDQLDEFQLEVLGYLISMVSFHSKIKKRVPQELMVSYIMTFASSSEHFQPKPKKAGEKMIDTQFLVHSTYYLDSIVGNEEGELVDEINVDKVLLLIQYMLGAYLSTLEPFKDTEMKVLELLQDLMEKVK